MAADPLSLPGPCHLHHGKRTCTLGHGGGAHAAAGHHTHALAGWRPGCCPPRLPASAATKCAAAAAAAASQDDHDVALLDFYGTSEIVTADVRTGEIKHIGPARLYTE